MKRLLLVTYMISMGNFVWAQVGSTTRLRKKLCSRGSLNGD
jgi:hypothetical protein